MQHLGATEGRQNTNPTPSQVRGAVRAESKLHWPREQLVWEQELSQLDLCSTRTGSTGTCNNNEAAATSSWIAKEAALVEPSAWQDCVPVLRAKWA